MKCIEIGREMKKAYGDKAKTFKVKLKYTKEITEYLNKIREAHEKASESKLIFK